MIACCAYVCATLTISISASAFAFASSSSLFIYFFRSLNCIQYQAILCCYHCCYIALSSLHPVNGVDSFFCHHNFLSNMYTSGFHIKKLCTIISPKNQVDIYDRRLWYLSLVAALHRSFFFISDIGGSRLKVDRIETHIYLQTICVFVHTCTSYNAFYQTNDNKKCSNFEHPFFSWFVLHSVFFRFFLSFIAKTDCIEVKEKSVLSHGNKLKTTYQRRKITNRNER